MCYEIPNWACFGRQKAFSLGSRGRSLTTVIKDLSMLSTNTIVFRFEDSDVHEIAVHPTMRKISLQLFIVVIPIINKYKGHQSLMTKLITCTILLSPGIPPIYLLR